jgi:hypothetical protein
VEIHDILSYCQSNQIKTDNFKQANNGWSSLRRKFPKIEKKKLFFSPFTNYCLFVRVLTFFFISNPISMSTTFVSSFFLSTIVVVSSSFRLYIYFFAFFLSQNKSADRQRCTFHLNFSARMCLFVLRFDFFLLLHFEMFWIYFFEKHFVRFISFSFRFRFLFHKNEKKKLI